MEARLKNCIDKINDMLLDEKYEWADKTLKGLLHTIDKHQYVSMYQREAIDNILKARPESETYKEWME